MAGRRLFGVSPAPRRRAFAPAKGRLSTRDFSHRSIRARARAARARVDAPRARRARLGRAISRPVRSVTKERLFRLFTHTR